MRLELLLLVAAAFPSCLSRRDQGQDSRRDFWDSRQDSRQDSRLDSQDSRLDSRQDSQDSRQDSRLDSQNSPQDFPQDSRLDSQGSPQDSRGSPQDSRGSHLDSRQDSQDSCLDSRRGSPQDSPLDSQNSPQDPRGSPRGSPQDSRQDPRGSPQDSRDSQGSPQDSRGSPRAPRRRPALPPRLLPAPLILQLPPDPPGPPRIRCLAPRRFSGSTFELFPGIPGEIPAGIVPVRSVPAAPHQHWAEFPVAGAARCWRCRYRSHNGSAWLESELSPAIGSPDLGDAECQRSDVTDPPWLLPLSLGAAALGLLLLLGAAAAAWRGLRRRGQVHTVPAPSLPMAPAPSLSQ